MPSSSQRAIVLAAVVAIIGGAVYFAAFAGKNTTDNGGPAPSIQISTDHTAAERPDPLATADAPRDHDPNQIINVDVMLWRTADVDTPAPNSRLQLLGAGKTATLRGVLADSRGPAVNTTVKFIHGLNEGITVTTNDAGYYEIPSLYPGAGIVEFEAQAQPKVRRQVVLRSNQTERLDINYLDWGNVHGQVIDENGKPIVGARVELDGIAIDTDKDGAFFFNSVVPGDLILYFSAPGRETRRENIVLRPGQALVFDVNRFILKKAEPIKVVIDPMPLDGRPPKIVLLPNDPFSTHTFPFEKIGVVSPRIGDKEVTIEGVPIGEFFQLRAYSDAGVASPAMRPIILKEEDTNLSRATFSFTWKSPVSGMVVSGGKPVANAKIRLESCDIARATAELLTECGGLSQVIVPILPLVRKETFSTADGNFRIESSETPTPAVIVIEAQGYARKIIPIKGGAPENLGNIDITKNPADASSKLSLSFQDSSRRNVRLFLDGRAQPLASLPAGSRLDIGNLTMGNYGVRVRENGAVAMDKLTYLNPGDNTLRVPKIVNFSNAEDEPEEPVAVDDGGDEPDPDEGKDKDK